MGILEEKLRGIPEQMAPLVTMWHRLRNFIANLKTYRDLSPDLKLRRRVRRRLSDRLSLQQEQWCIAAGQASQVSYPVARFAYTYLAQYSGLDFSRVRLEDNLEQDLCWSEICWFDWRTQLSEDLLCSFGTDLSEQIEWADWETIADLLAFLTCQLTSEPPLEQCLGELED